MSLRRASVFPRVGIRRAHIGRTFLRFRFFLKSKFSETRAMEIVRRSLYLVFIVVVNFENSQFCHCEMRSTTLDLIILGLYRDVEFMYERPGQMNVDAIFGLNLAQVHVGAVLEHENAIFLTEKNRITLQVILTLCQIAENDGKKLVKASGLEMMIRTEVWNRTIFWRLGELGERPSTSAGLSEAEVPRLFYQGSPSESESLRCFIDLLVRDENRICRISKECAEMLERNDCSRGYPLTHRILYAQLATALGCQTISLGGLESMKKAFCTTVLQDLVDLESMNFPFFSRDLAMEQIAVCGMNGYLEFTNERYAKLITSWPNSHGCFSAFGFGEGDEKKRGKRSTSKMDYGCDNHASGVAAACLSLLIRSAVENLDPLFF